MRHKTLRWRQVVCMIWPFGLLVLTLAVASGRSWACVPQPFLLVQPRSSGPSGSQVTVQGQNMAGGRVELRWNALDGPLLGTAEGPSFSVPVTIPDQSTGLYVVVALERLPDGSFGSLARAEFAIPAEGTPATPPAHSASSGNDGGGGTVTTAVAVTLTLAGAIALFMAGAVWSASRRRHARSPLPADSVSGQYGEANSETASPTPPQ